MNPVNAVRPTTAEERDARTARNGGAPTLEFGRKVPYDAYVHASTLHTLQRTLSGDPGEMSFLVVSQIMELYFKLIRHELEQARDHVRADQMWEALAPLKRAALHLEGLNAAWQTLRWMTPADFNKFRDLLGEGSGFQSAMYRQVEFLLGLRTKSLMRPHKGTAAYDELEAALHQPSLWDEVIALLARHGYDLKPELLDRDVADEHEAEQSVSDAWVRVYRDTSPENHLRLLGEALTEVADRFGDWRYLHLKAVQRTMGAKSGSGGSSGLAFLQRSMSRPVFPELWTSRTEM
ncbi:tryptophan 2,3-dioxygenase family protein [Actinoplanes sp. Pm04-4]|uniref:Tryptophan 2,3-dioxygenase n=1 Tax=Paractinoplanes pyxinae TaxID=2997416 RepID=A0ABT4AR71_9ACTN|nr:tryptophan 2,3-dioxygenase family protein [Actinoplanes pyxinae]MCY1136743.1 tryptophan 2,3-dioxygenase family protein [Actinoplanes pyxinae]